MSILVRVDDFPGHTPANFHKHNLENFKKFDEIMQKNGIQYLLGVIPIHLDGIAAKYMVEHPHIVVGMHGISHDERFPNEFREHLTESEVWSMVQTQKAYTSLLVSSNIDTYVPPHNVFDIRTCHALVRAGFKRITGGPESDRLVTPEAVSATGLKYCYSSAPLEYAYTYELLAAGSVPYMQDEAPTRDIYLTLHWTWEHSRGFATTDEYLSQLVGLYGTWR